MSKADSIKDIRFKLRKLCDITDELMENLTKLHDSVHNGSFIPETLNQKMTDGLRSISQLQTEIFQEYASLEIGDLPDDYDISHDSRWHRIPTAEQVAKIGNAVVPSMSKAIVSANCPYLYQHDRVPFVQVSQQQNGQFSFA